MIILKKNKDICDDVLMEMRRQHNGKLYFSNMEELIITCQKAGAKYVRKEWICRHVFVSSWSLVRLLHMGEEAPRQNILPWR